MEAPTVDANRKLLILLDLAIFAPDFAPNRDKGLSEKGVLVAGGAIPIQDRPMGELTQLLEAMRAGDAGAIDEVFTLTYRELHEMAHQRLHRSNRVTSLDTTALVHECYLRLVRLGQLQTRDRSHFLGYAACVMRSIVVDFVRQRLAKRRGGGELRVTLGTDIRDSAAVNEEQIMQVDEALQELAALDPKLVQVVEMRYFAGFTVEQIAESRGVTTRTIRRDWEKARLLLYAALQK
jgi:RNA polymerase sigma factor (TIGR02999 family)